MILAGWCAIWAVTPAECDTLQLKYNLHGQTRRFRCVFTPESDGGVTLSWGIERNLRWWSGSYRMTPSAMNSGDSMSFLMPEDGNNVALGDGETFAMISRKALGEPKERGRFTYDGFVYELTDTLRSSPIGQLLHVKEPLEGAEMWIADNETLPIVWEMRGNPLEINWTTRKL